MAHDGHDHHDHHDHPHHHHHDDAPQVQVGAWVVTCSDTRNATTDLGGPLVKRLLEEAGHTVLGAELVADDAHAIDHALEHALSHGARAIIFTGGTGIARRDVTLEALEPRFEKRLDGFGELFRMISYELIGPAAMASRASAGVVKGAVVFAIPGNPDAVKLALSALILPQLGHLVRELVK